MLQEGFLKTNNGQFWQVPQSCGKSQKSNGGNRQSQTFHGVPRVESFGAELTKHHQTLLSKFG